MIFIDEIHAPQVRLMELLYEALRCGALTLLVTEPAEASGLRVTGSAADLPAGVAHGAARLLHVRTGRGMEREAATA